MAITLRARLPLVELYWRVATDCVRRRGGLSDGENYYYDDADDDDDGGGGDDGELLYLLLWWNWIKKPGRLEGEFMPMFTVQKS